MNLPVAFALPDSNHRRFHTRRPLWEVVCLPALYLIERVRQAASSRQRDWQKRQNGSGCPAAAWPLREWPPCSFRASLPSWQLRLPSKKARCPKLFSLSASSDRCGAHNFLSIMARWTVGLLPAPAHHERGITEHDALGHHATSSLCFIPPPL